MTQETHFWWIIILLFVLLVPIFLIIFPCFPWGKSA
ncbi:MAG: hypothetical protein PWR07_1494 [Bacillota bacterium]|nr:hypothetical protein [Bacillota bacterium]